MDDLVAFVRAQLDALEASAEDVHRMDEGNVELCGLYWFVEGEYMGLGSCTCGEPAAVRASVAADRAILDMFTTVMWADGGQDLYSDGWSGLEVAERGARLLAQKFVGRPGWRPEWSTKP